MRGRAKASAQRDEPVAPASPDESHRRATDGDTLVPVARVEGLDFADDVGAEITPLQRRAESHPAVEDDVIGVFVVHDSAPIHEGQRPGAANPAPGGFSHVAFDTFAALTA